MTDQEFDERMSAWRKQIERDRQVVAWGRRISIALTVLAVVLVAWQLLTL